MNEDVKAILRKTKLPKSEDDMEILTEGDNSYESYTGERKYESLVCKTLDALGLEYERQKWVGNGRIDIFVYGQPPAIIELKRDSAPGTLMAAIVQLKFYSANFKDPALYIMTPLGIEADRLPLLWEFGVDYLQVLSGPDSSDPTARIFGKLVKSDPEHITVKTIWERK